MVSNSLLADAATATIRGDRAVIFSTNSFIGTVRCPNGQPHAKVGAGGVRAF